MTTKTELACVYSALILVDDDIAVTVRKFHVFRYSLADSSHVFVSLYTIVYIQFCFILIIMLLFFFLSNYFIHWKCKGYFKYEKQTNL